MVGRTVVALGFGISASRVLGTGFIANGCRACRGSDHGIPTLVVLVAVRWKASSWRFSPVTCGW